MFIAKTTAILMLSLIITLNNVILLPADDTSRFDYNRLIQEPYLPEKTRSIGDILSDNKVPIIVATVLGGVSAFGLYTWWGAKEPEPNVKTPEQKAQAAKQVILDTHQGLKDLFTAHNSYKNNELYTKLAAKVFDKDITEERFKTEVETTLTALQKAAQELAKEAYKSAKERYDKLDVDGSVAVKAKEAGFISNKFSNPNFNKLPDKESIANEVPAGAETSAFANATEVINKVIKNYQDEIVKQIRVELEGVINVIGQADWSDGDRSVNAGSLIEKDAFNKTQIKDKDIDQLIALLDPLINASIKKIETGLKHAKKRNSMFDPAQEIAYTDLDKQEVTYNKGLKYVNSTEKPKFYRLSTAENIIVSLSKIKSTKEEGVNKAASQTAGS